MPWVVRFLIGCCFLFIQPLFSKPEFHEFKYRHPWPTKRSYPYHRDLDEYKEISVTEKSHPGYKELLLHTDKQVYKIALNHDGSKLAAILNIHGSPRLFYINPQETILQEFSTSYGFSDSSPAITSNAEKIYFVSDRFGNKEIYLAEYEKFQKNTAYTVDIQVDNLFHNTDPSTDAQGTTIAYVSSKEGGFSQIFIKHLPTGKEIVPSDLTHRSMRPRLSYDGQHITYISFFKNNYEVYYADLTKKTAVNISDHHGRDFHSEISGDGNRIIFESDRNGLRDIFLLDRGDFTLYNLSHSKKADDFNPVISADGQIIAFESHGKWEDRSISVIDFNQKLIFRFHTLKESYSRPALSPDGKVLLFAMGHVVYRVDLEKVKDNTGTG